MGAWGHKVFENDSALDFMIGPEKTIIKVLQRKRFSQGDYDEMRAAIATATALQNAGYTVSLDENIPWTTIALQKLSIILNDSEYIEGWNSKTNILRSINTQIKNVEKCRIKHLNSIYSVIEQRSPEK